MLPEKVEQMLNDQIQKEFYSAYLYLSMSAYLEDQNLKGYAHWFKIQAQEERDHALIIYNYVWATGGRVKLQAIQEPPVEFDGVEGVLTETLAHEQKVTNSINQIVDAAMEARDHKTVQMLQWFIQEQVEEEDTARNNIDQFRLFGGDPKGLLMLDREMSQRVYTVPAPLANAN